MGNKNWFMIHATYLLLSRLYSEAGHKQKWAEKTEKTNGKRKKLLALFIFVIHVNVSHSHHTWMHWFLSAQSSLPLSYLFTSSFTSSSVRCARPYMAFIDCHIFIAFLLFIYLFQSRSPRHHQGENGNNCVNIWNTIDHITRYIPIWEMVRCILCDI